LSDKRPSRPFGVKAITALYLFSALSSILAVLLLDVLAGNSDFTDIRRPELQDLPLIVLAIAQIVIVVGFWRLQRWAWYLVMVFAGVTMAVDLWQYFWGSSYYMSMFINVIIVLYLNQRDVQQAFLHNRKAETSP
jgi:hypothetical protein